MMKEQSYTDFRELVAALAGSKDARNRDLVCTPCGGNYGLAGWLVALEGSPPHAIIFLGPCRYTGKDDVFLIRGSQSRRLGDEQCRVSRRFQDDHLRAQADEGAEFDAFKPITLRGEPRQP